MNDHDIDRRARAYAAQHRVDYVQAVRAVHALGAQFSESALVAAPIASDADMDQRASRYAAQHRVSYFEAVRCVQDMAALSPAAFAESRTARPRSAGLSDAEVHSLASSYASRRGVGYVEAMRAVMAEAAGQAVHFAEKGAAAALQGQSIEIFRAGSREDTQGIARTLTAADLANAAAAYDPATHEAPLGVGVATGEGAAYGWVKSLRADNGTLYAELHQVDEAFAQLFSAGRFKQRETAFYSPTDTNNPVPGIWYLRSVTWHGAPPPPVKGLKAPAGAQFTEPDRALITFEVALQ